MRRVTLLAPFLLDPSSGPSPARTSICGHCNGRSCSWSIGAVQGWAGIHRVSVGSAVCGTRSRNRYQRQEAGTGVIQGVLLRTLLVSSWSGSAKSRRPESCHSSFRLMCQSPLHPLYTTGVRAKVKLTGRLRYQDATGSTRVIPGKVDIGFPAHNLAPLLVASVLDHLPASPSGCGVGTMAAQISDINLGET